MLFCSFHWHFSAALSKPIAMANHPAISLPLQERTARRNNLLRASQCLILALLLSLLIYRLSFLHTHVGLAYTLSLLAFCCESWFAFVWTLTMIVQWNPIEHNTYPERLLNRLEPGLEFPAVDMFVTTADPFLEPPIITVNTVLSLLALDYPANKLSCYVSDDGGSAITYYAMVEAAKFAGIWVPFCRKYRVEVRAPFMYFSKTKKAAHGFSPSFEQEWRRMKNEYEALSSRITEAIQQSIPSRFAGYEFDAFSNIERGNHPSIVKVVMENKENLPDGLPHLIYIAREKRPKCPHHFKAGAMNVLTRVSGIMTNAPFMLNVDCDMFANNQLLVYHAMCFFLGSDTERNSGFVQFPQRFYGGLKDDPFGNQLKAMFHYMGHGIAGLQGPLYSGTCCFHRRKIIYGSPPGQRLPSHHESLKGEVRSTFGDSREFIDSAVRIISEQDLKMDNSRSLASTLEAAKKVAGCTYELNTLWGNEVGWAYGSVVEDFLTGLRIHAMGWKSIMCTPNPPAFLGRAPSSGPSSLTQQKRWGTGLLEVLVSKKGPLVATLRRKVEFRQCLAYVVIGTWALRSIPEFCYATLPAFCLLTSTTFLPKIYEPAILFPASPFLFYNLLTLGQYLSLGLSVREWWNNMRMRRIVATTAWLFSILSVLLKLLGISNTVFEITNKEETPEAANCKEAGRFTFDSSPFFIPGTTLLFLNMAALAVGLHKLLLVHGGWAVVGVSELICSTWVVLSFMPFFKGLFGKGNYGIPRSIIYKSAFLTLLCFHFFWWISRA